MATKNGHHTSTLYDGEEPAMLEPLIGARVISEAIHKLTDGRVFECARGLKLNLDCDATILRNRLERYEMRRHLGAQSAPWNPAQDECRDWFTAQPAGSGLTSSRHSTIEPSSSLIDVPVESVQSSHTTEARGIGNPLSDHMRQNY